MTDFTLTSRNYLSFVALCSALGANLQLGCSSKDVPASAENTGGSGDNGGLGNSGGSTNSSGNSGNLGGSSANSSGGSGNPGGATGAPGGSTSTSIVNINPVLSDGNSNALSSGGYWWTYTDHNANGSPYHATISQVTSQVVALQPTQDSDPTHGSVLRIQGSVPPSIPWALASTQDPTSIDGHWSAIYVDAKIPAYPEAGIGFGFLGRNAPFDATGAGKWVGIAFDMKIGVETPAVWVSMPMVGTDLPDPSYADNFPKQCDYYTATNTPATGYQTCMTHYRKGLRDSLEAPNEYGELGSVGTWKHYCVLYSEVGVPGWVNPLTREHMPAFDPTKLLKVQWGMYQPVANSTAASYDISLDNVRLITRAEAADTANNCNPTMLNAAPGSGNEG